jgi:hypothetical protein
MSFEQNIQQWVSIDNQMKSLTDKMKELRGKKNNLRENLNTYAETKNLSSSIIKINDGELKFVQVKDTQQLTFKYLELCLNQIIKNEEQVSKIVEYVRNNREVTYVGEIKRYYNK